MERIKDFLEERKNNNLLRTLKPAEFRAKGWIHLKGKKYLDFSSNDYLGLSSHPKLKQASQQAIKKFGTGSSASRLLSGDLDIFHKLEKKVADFKGKEKALIFNSGYQANLGIISALFKPGDVIFSDRLNHASIIDGITLSGARFFRFQHNDLNHLESLLKIQRPKFKNSLIITETIFSMDGDKAKLKTIVTLKKRYKSKLMVDEAHATGIFGKNGSGLVEEYDLAKDCDLIMGTFSKALGSFGAYLACSDKIRSYLINTCRSFIYSTALPASVIGSNLASLDLIAKEPYRRQELFKNCQYFRKKLKELKFKIKGWSQIVPLIVGSNQKAMAISKALQNKGYWVLPVRPPTVPRNEARLRFSLTYYHKKPILDKLIDDISNLKF
jgi:8-amino-7-oxononanoate synthase